MRCRICKREAVHRVRSFGIALCEQHLEEFCLKRVKEAIRRYKMFNKKDKVLVAVSGGKDSLVTWDILVKLGFNVTALFLLILEFRKRIILKRPDELLIPSPKRMATILLFLI